MWKLTMGIPFFNVPYGHISLYVLANQQPFRYGRDYSRFEKSFSKVAIESGYQRDGEETVPAGKASAYYLRFTRSSDGQLSLRCFIENSVVVLFYEGSSK
jgi:hypothetical protein